MTKLEIRCPSCSKRGNIEVSEEDVKKTSRGLFAVNIAEGIVCEHSFVTYVDKNLSIRDTYIADFQIELPTAISEQETVVDRDISEQFDIDLIKLNLTASLLGFVLRAMIYKKKIVIISNQDYLFDQISKFFEYITHDLFDIDLSIVTVMDYNKQSYGEHFAFKGREIAANINNLISPKKLNVEKNIVQKFLNEYEPITSLIILKNEIQKIFELSKTIVNLLNKNKEKFYTKIVMQELEKVHKVKIAYPYLDFLYEVVENYFEVVIPKTSSVSDFLGFL